MPPTHPDSLILGRHLSFIAGASGVSDTLDVSAYDGTDWGAATFHVSATANHAPVVTASDAAAVHGQSIAVSAVISASGADRDPIGHFVFNGVVQTANQCFLVTPSPMAQPSFVAGASGVSDTLEFSAHDGTDWGAAATFHVTVPL